MNYSLYQADNESNNEILNGVDEFSKPYEIVAMIEALATAGIDKSFIYSSFNKLDNSKKEVLIGALNKLDKNLSK